MHWKVQLLHRHQNQNEVICLGYLTYRCTLHIISKHKFSPIAFWEHLVFAKKDCYSDKYILECIVYMKKLFCFRIQNGFKKWKWGSNWRQGVCWCICNYGMYSLVYLILYLDVPIGRIICISLYPDVPIRRFINIIKSLRLALHCKSGK